MDVYALVGPAGTGKSHRASVVARELDIPLIIDDGLLVREGRILAGLSAKREPSALAAVRRAVFTDAEQARTVKAAIEETGQERILVLGTSREMVHKICDALDLPRPERYLDITDVASQEEIQLARRVRRREGKHVIPAPTFEVKKGFSGYLVDPLRFLYRGRRGQRDANLLIEKSVVRPTFSLLGRFYIGDNVVAAIAQHAMREVEGVVDAARVQVESSDEGVTIRADLLLRYGLPMQPVMRAAQRQGKAAVENMTALNVLRCDVVVRRVIMEKT